MSKGKRLVYRYSWLAGICLVVVGIMLWSCDGGGNGDDAEDAAIWYLDSDTDGYGDPGNRVRSEKRPQGYVSNSHDCDDYDPDINPDGVEICGDGIDQDCDGGDLTCSPTPEDLDDDGDGYTENQGDCNDQNAGMHPGAVEICGDGIDQDCNGGDLGCAPDDSGRVQPTDLQYLGAFRLPDAFNWGARGMSYYPEGAGGAGSLLITTSEALRTPEGTSCYEGLTDCAAYFAEVAIPEPTQSTDWTILPEAAFLTSPTIFDDGLVQTVHPADAYVTGIEYVPRQGSQTSDKIYGSLNEWYPEGDYGEASFPTVWFSNLDGSNARGVFHVGPQTDPLYHGRKMGDFLFTVPAWYADAYLGGRTLVTGRSRGTPVGADPETTQGGSQGPTLFAFMPLTSDDPGTTELDALPMLYYRVRYPGCAGPDIGVGGTAVDCDYPGFSMCDSWDGGGFIGTREKNAIVLLGHKGSTNCYYCDETGDDPECHVTPVNGECVRYCDEGQGYHCGPYHREILFYDTGQLAGAAQGVVSPWEILPYEIWRPTDFFLSGTNVCGGVGGMAYDEANHRLFAIERGLGGHQGENAAVVHVWRVN